MKKSLLLLVVLLLLQSCIGWGNGDDVIADPFPNGAYEAVVIQRADFETSTILENTPRVIENSGKIYVKGNFIYINEVNKGFHIIDNTDPSNPQNSGFIQVLGSSDLSIKEDVFYANNATDLLAFKIDDATQTITITKRLENIFPQLWSPDGFSFYQTLDNEIIVDWELINE